MGIAGIGDGAIGGATARGEAGGVAAMAFEQHRAVDRIDRERLGAEIAGDHQFGAVPHGPARDHAGAAERGRAQAAGAGDAADDVAVAQAEQHPHLRADLGVMVAGVGPRQLVGFDRVGVGNLRAALLVGERGEAGELLAPPFAHRVGKFVVVVGEEQVGRIGAVFLAHEQHRDLRRQ